MKHRRFDFYKNALLFYVFKSYENKQIIHLNLDFVKKIFDNRFDVRYPRLIFISSHRQTDWLTERQPDRQTYTLIDRQTGT